ncbi:MAG TPA: hypothetical protein VI895_13635 [Bdellovibrionota bacterium]|nr:hypothetical protein [Bdellovibrionota bacterium]
MNIQTRKLTAWIDGSFIRWIFVSKALHFAIFAVLLMLPAASPLTVRLLSSPSPHSDLSSRPVRPQTSEAFVRFAISKFGVESGNPGKRALGKEGERPRGNIYSRTPNRMDEKSAGLLGILRERTLARNLFDHLLDRKP